MVHKLSALIHVINEVSRLLSTNNWLITQILFTINPLRIICWLVNINILSTRPNMWCDQAEIVEVVATCYWFQGFYPNIAGFKNIGIICSKHKNNLISVKCRVLFWLILLDHVTYIKNTSMISKILERLVWENHIIT